LTSIQRNLVLWAALALAGGMAVVMAATYAFAYSQITSVFDEELVKIAEAVHLREDWRGPTRVRIPRHGFNLSVRAYNERGASYFETVEPSMPHDLPKLFQPGYTVMLTEGGRWRVYTHVTGEGIVQVGQPEATRTSLARTLSLRMALPELVLIPLFVLFMAGVLRRALTPLRDISRRVEERDATRLDALPAGDVPAELRPLIGQINALLKRLADSMAAQRRFVADAAHELRTPVAALALQVQVAERAAQPATRAAAYGELKNGIARAARVVEQLLKLAQLGPDVPAPGLQPVDLAAIAREVVGGMAYRARTLGIDLGAEASAPAPMLGANTELRSLITNLLENALRYAPRDTEVTVRVTGGPAGVRMVVMDAGPGIPAAERECVFERFQRASGDDTSGIGLGLAIAKAIVERHGGRIWLEEALPGRSPPGLAACVVFPPGAG
jgi:two-component system, OmpR family, sensor kinase